MAPHKGVAFHLVRAAPVIAHAPIWAEVDRQGLLLRCDPDLAVLQRAAGGSASSAVKIPQLSRMVARVLGDGQWRAETLVAALDNRTYRIEARVVPLVNGALIELTDWRESEPGGPSDFGPMDAASIEQAADPDRIAFELDERLTIQSLSLIPGADIVDAWLGRSVSELFRLQPDAEGYFPLLRAFAQGEAFSGQSAIAGAGVARTVALSGTPILNHVGRCIGYRAVATANAVQGQGAALAAATPHFDHGAVPHGVDNAMREVITRIIAHAEAMADKVDGPIRQDYSNYARDMATASTHLLGLVDDLADLQLIERSDYAPRMEEVDLADISRKAAALLAVDARDRDIQLFPPAKAERLIVTAEIRRVQQILLNLVGNAIRYSPLGSSVRISLDRGQSTATVTVADDGEGMDADQQARLFQRFERLGRKDPGGSGLGLYLSRTLARAMGGDLTVKSEPGCGASFTLTLPAGP